MFHFCQRVETCVADFVAVKGRFTRLVVQAKNNVDISCRAAAAARADQRATSILASEGCPYSGVPRMAYYVRIHETDTVLAAAKAFDELVIGAWSDIAGCEPDAITKLVAHLPARMGGCGFTRYELIAEAAFQSSRDTFFLGKPVRQHDLVDALNQKMRDELLSAHPRARLHLSECAKKGASEWFRCAIGPQVIADDAFAAMLCARMFSFPAGAKLLECPGACTYKPIDERDWVAHVLGCAKVRGLNPSWRHKVLKDKMRSAVYALCGISCEGVEPRLKQYKCPAAGCGFIDHNKAATERHLLNCANLPPHKKGKVAVIATGPDDTIYILHRILGYLKVLIDYTIVATTSVSNAPNSDPANKTTFAAVTNTKRRKYEAAAIARGELLVIFAGSAYGNLANEATDFIKQIAYGDGPSWQELARTVSQCIVHASGTVLLNAFHAAGVYATLPPVLLEELPLSQQAAVKGDTNAPPPDAAEGGNAPDTDAAAETRPCPLVAAEAAEAVHRCSASDAEEVARHMLVHTAAAEATVHSEAAGRRGTASAEQAARGRVSERAAAEAPLELVLAIANAGENSERKAVADAEATAHALILALAAAAHLEAHELDENTRRDGIADEELFSRALLVARAAAPSNGPATAAAVEAESFCRFAACTAESTARASLAGLFADEAPRPPPTQGEDSAPSKPNNTQGFGSSSSDGFGASFVAAVYEAPGASAQWCASAASSARGFYQWCAASWARFFRLVSCVLFVARCVAVAACIGAAIRLHADVAQYLSEPLASAVVLAVVLALAAVWVCVRPWVDMAARTCRLVSIVSFFSLVSVFFLYCFAFSAPLPPNFLLYSLGPDAPNQIASGDTSTNPTTSTPGEHILVEDVAARPLVFAQCLPASNTILLLAPPALAPVPPKNPATTAPATTPIWVGVVAPVVLFNLAALISVAGSPAASGHTPLHAGAALSIVSSFPSWFVQFLLLCTSTPAVNAFAAPATAARKKAVGNRNGAVVAPAPLAFGEGASAAHCFCYLDANCRHPVPLGCAPPLLFSFDEKMPSPRPCRCGALVGSSLRADREGEMDGARAKEEHGVRWVQRKNSASLLV